MNSFFTKIALVAGALICSIPNTCADNLRTSNKLTVRRLNLKKSLFEESNTFSEEGFGTCEADQGSSCILFQNLRVRFPAAIAFDIDGVLLREYTPIDKAKETLELCKKYNIPFMFLTNGGGMLETKKLNGVLNAMQVRLDDIDEVHLDHFKEYVDNPWIQKDPALQDLASYYLESEEPPQKKERSSFDRNALSVDRIQMCHTPMKKLTSLYADKLLLAIGSRDYVKVLQTYGFNYVYTAYDVAQIWPDLYGHFRDIVIDPSIPDPSPVIRKKLLTEAYKQQFMKDADETFEFDEKTMEKPPLIVKPDVIMTIQDPIDWHLETVVLMGSLYRDAFENPGGPVEEQTPIYASHFDLLFSSKYPLPMFGPANFFIALEAIVKKVLGREIRVKKFGKPYLRSIKSAVKVVETMAKKIITQNVMASAFVHHIISMYVTRADEKKEEPAEEVKEVANSSREPEELPIATVLRSLNTTPLLNFFFRGTDVFSAFKSKLFENPLPKRQLNQVQMEKMKQIKQKMVANIEETDVVFDNIYMIGDNPSSDVQTATNAKEPWKSFLVKTGVYTPVAGQLNDPKHPADYVVENAYDAVLQIIRDHNLQPIS